METHTAHNLLKIYRVIKWNLDVLGQKVNWNNVTIIEHCLNHLTLGKKYFVNLFCERHGTGSFQFSDLHPTVIDYVPEYLFLMFDSCFDLLTPVKNVD